MPGGGNQPAGTSFAGGYIPQPAAPGPTVLPSPTTGLPQTGRLINPKTRRFVYTSDGRAEGMGTVPQLVLIAWSTLDFSDVPVLGAGYENQIRSKYLAAVRSFQTLLQITSFSVQRVPGSNAVAVSIGWRDLTTQLDYVYPPPLASGQ
jgi:hypothetical protein